MTQDSFQRTTLLSRVWSVVEKVVTSTDKNVLPDYRAFGQDVDLFEKIALVAFQSVLPRKVWLSNFDKKPLSEYMTVADEALACLILENNFADWMKIAKKQVEDVKKRKRDTKYTMQPTSGAGTKLGGARKGWSYEGKKQYNQYYDLIAKKRELVGVKEMEMDILQRWKNEEDELTTQDDVAEEAPPKKKIFKPRSGFSIAKLS